MLVSGDAGIGKTRLVEELIRHARRQGAVVLTGDAIDLAEAPPFWPVLSAIRNAVRADPDGDTRALLRQWLAGLPHANGDGVGVGLPVQLLDLLHQLVVDLAERRAVLLVLEDLQWADRSTRDLVAYLVANLVHEPVLLVVTFRMDSPRRMPDFSVALAELRRFQKVSALELHALPREALAELVAEWAPGRADLEELAWQRSAGNAFVAEQTVHAVLGGDEQGLPSTLREIVLSRIALLSPAGQQVVRALAAGVGPVRHRLLADVLDLAPATLLGSVREAMAHGIVRVDESGEGYQLRHGLMTEVVAADLLPGERIDLHRRFALALTRAGDSSDPGIAAQLAHHWYEADNPEEALRASVAAARASEAIHAHAEAHRHWLRAADLVGRAPVDTVGLLRTDCLDRAARAAGLAGDHEQAVVLLERLLSDPGTPDGLPSALLAARKGSSLAAAGRAADAERSYRAAAAFLPESGAEAERAQVLAGYGAALLHALDFAGARDVALHALELARRGRASTVEARILAVLGFSSAYLADAEAGSAAIAEALLVAEGTGEPEAIGEAHLRRAELLAGPLNRLAEGVECARDGVERMRALGLARTAGVALLTYAANALFRLGQWDQAEAAVAEAWALGPTGADALDVRLARCRIALARGRLAAAAADLDAVDLLSRSTAGPRHRIPLLVLSAAFELWRREPAAALRHVEDGLDLAEAGAGDIWSLAPLVWHGTRAWADLVTAGLPPPAAAQVDRLRHHCVELTRRGMGTAPAVRAVVEAFSLMCDGEAARAEHRPEPAAWEQAVRMWERHQQPYPAAYAQLRRADALLQRGPRSAVAAGVLQEAEKVARRLGAQPLLDDIVDLAGRARVPLAEPMPPAPAGSSLRTPLDNLTTRELEVLTELAKGLTNREIGERLYISEKTVGVHVSRIFHKIGVHSRVQASAVLHRSRPVHDGW
jgi:DNA-binding CsgD family transcriptional regulator